jgi:hypothetical protein
MAWAIGVSCSASLQRAVNVESPGTIAVAVSSAGGVGGALSTAICRETTMEVLPAASAAVSMRVCVPSESSVVGRLSVCGPVDSGQGRGKV